MKNLLSFAMIAMTLNFATAGYEETAMVCKPVNPNVTLNDIQVIRIVIDDHIQEYAHIESENSRGEVSVAGNFDLRRDSYSSLEVTRDESESPIIESIRVERAAGVERLVRLRSSFGRGITMDSVPIHCSL
jgi:hypothetical protein